MHPNTKVNSTTIAALAVLVAVIGTVSIALAAEAGYGPVQLIKAQTIGDPAGPCKSADTAASIALARAPQYPEIALAEGVEGFATVTFTMALDGSASNVKLAGTSGNRLLDHAAIDAVKSARFAPEMDNCAKIAGLYGVPVVFSQSNAHDWPNIFVGNGARTGGHIVVK